MPSLPLGIASRWWILATSREKWRTENTVPVNQTHGHISETAGRSTSLLSGNKTLQVEERAYQWPSSEIAFNERSQLQGAYKKARSLSSVLNTTCLYILLQLPYHKKKGNAQCRYCNSAIDGSGRYQYFILNSCSVSYSFLFPLPLLPARWQTHAHTRRHSINVLAEFSRGVLKLRVTARAFAERKTGWIFQQWAGTQQVEI